MGSPSRVPVPCASTTSTSAPASRAAVSAWRITRCCDGPFGARQAVRGAVLVDRAAADHREHLVAVAAGRRTAAPAPARPAPSAQPVPSAAAANDLHRPSAARPRCRENSTNVVGRGHHRHATGQRQRALAGPQRLARPGAGRPARTSTRCRPSPRAPRARARRRRGRRRRCPRCRWRGSPRRPRARRCRRDA